MYSVVIELDRPAILPSGGTSLSEPLLIQDRKAADAFAGSKRRRLILQLAKREQSLLELSRSTEMSLSLLTYHVDRLRALGLVTISRETPRAGRSVKYYRAVASSFFVPAHLENGASGRELHSEMALALDRARLASPDEGTLYFIDENENVRAQRVLEAGPSAATEIWRILRLTKRDAELLSADLREVLHRYAQRAEDNQARPYLAHIALAPRNQ